MFRTARGFLLIAPPAFFLALVSYLIAHPHGAESFTPYPFLADTLGQGLMKRTLGRFAASSALFFLLPYLVTGLLLLFADLGATAAGPLWGTRPKGKRPRIPIESLVAFIATAALLSIVGGVELHRVAHGGELPGGVNVTPIFVAVVPFAAIGAATVMAAFAAVPRAAAARLSGGPRRAAARS